jgi:hypothetical protein
VICLGPRDPVEIAGPARLSAVVSRRLNSTVRRRHAERDFLATLQNEIRKRTDFGEVPSFEAPGMHTRKGIFGGVF